YRPVAEGWLGSGEGGEGLSSLGAAHAPEGLFRWLRLPGLLSSRQGEGGYSGNPRHDGGSQDGRPRNGGTRFSAAPAGPGNRKCSDREGLPGKGRDRVPRVSWPG